MRLTDQQLTDLEAWAARISETDGAWDPDTDGIVSPQAQCAAIKALVEEVRERRAADVDLDLDRALMLLDLVVKSAALVPPTDPHVTPPSTR